MMYLGVVHIPARRYITWCFTEVFSLYSFFEMIYLLEYIETNAYIQYYVRLAIFLLQHAILYAQNILCLFTETTPLKYYTANAYGSLWLYSNRYRVTV